MSISSDEEEVFIPISTWSYPSFVKAFEASRFQQFDDAIFRAVVTGNPVPEVAWTKKGQPLPKSDKYEYQYDANSGQVVLVIRDLGPGDEGQYTCSVSNDYGSVTATLKVNPDVNALRHGGLSHGFPCRASLQRKVKNNQKGSEDHHNGSQNGSQNGHYLEEDEEDSQSGMTL